MLLLTRLYVRDGSRVVEGASEKVSPAGGPTGIAHSSRMAGVNPQASPALRSIPHLPDTGTPHQAKVTNTTRLQQQSHCYWELKAFWMKAFVVLLREIMCYETIWIDKKWLMRLKQKCKVGASLQKVPETEILSYLSLGWHSGFLVLQNHVS